MGKVSATQRLIVEDFPKQKDWISPMFYVVNDFFQKVLSALNGGIEFSENILGVERELDFIYVSHAVSLPLRFKWTLNKKPRAVSVVAAYYGKYSGNLYDGVTSAWDATATAVLKSNSSLVPFLTSVTWEFTQDGEVSITDFSTIIGSVAKLTTPMTGQRVILRVRVTP